MFKDAREVLFWLQAFLQYVLAIEPLHREATGLILIFQCKACRGDLSNLGCSYFLEFIWFRC